MKNIKLIDNKRVSLKEVIDGIAIDHKELSIATGYCDLVALQALLEKVKNYNKIRLLIGKEPLLPRYKKNEIEEDFPELDLYNDLQELPYNSDFTKTIVLIRQLIQAEKLEIKIYKKDFLHAKAYIFGDYHSNNAVGIVGSSNLTKNGFSHNNELNVLEQDHRVVLFQPKNETQELGHLFWFDQFWNDENSVLWTGKFQEILELSPVGDILFSPYETYIKTLYELYKEDLQDDTQLEEDKNLEPLMAFQKKNVQALLRRIKKYKVAMLSDSVGLGKTFTAIEVIKGYLNHIEGRKRVEVICPKSLVSQWTKELAKRAVIDINPLTLQNPKQLEERQSIDKYASVGLFVIDESHNLKNSNGKRFEFILQWIQNNPTADVLLLTATPINNQISDLTNQLLLGTKGIGDKLKIVVVNKKMKTSSVVGFSTAMENLKKKITQDYTKTGEIDTDHIQQVMSPIIREFVVRRTRQGIDREYGTLKIAGKKQKFPQVIPEVKKYNFSQEVTKEISQVKSQELDLNKIYSLEINQILELNSKLVHPLDEINILEANQLQNQTAFDYIYKLILCLGFVPYRWQMYKTKYYGKKRDAISKLGSGSDRKGLFLQLSLYGILRTIFLKRFESSISALKSSVEIYQRKLDLFEKGLSKNKIISLKNFKSIEQSLGNSPDNFDELDLEEELCDIIENNNYDKAIIIADIVKEKALLNLLCQQLELLKSDDEKIKSFATLINNLKKEDKNKKILVFSFYADTVEYLREKLHLYIDKEILTTTEFLSTKNRQQADSLAGRFAPKAKDYDLKDNETQLHCLISTDILSEGQNLQDCGILINYDLHWNPVRMIQRNGRINRLGSEFEKVYIYNISPEQKLEQYLKLVKRLEQKINLIRNTIGTDTPVLSEEANPIEFTDNWGDIYSQDEQKRIKALQEAEQKTDFLLSEDQFFADLKEFDLSKEFPQEYKQAIYNIPAGKWAMMPKLKNRAATRKEVLAFSQLFDGNGEPVNYAFHSMDDKASSFQAVTNLQALDWLKTTKEDNRRITDTINLDKQVIKNKTKKNVLEYNYDTAEHTLTNQERIVLRILFKNHFAVEDIDKVRQAMGRQNQVFLKRGIKKLLSNIIKDDKKNSLQLETLRKLINLSSQLIEQKEIKKVDSSKQVLFFKKNNNI